MIWILATNALDPTIMEFCRKNKNAVFDATKQDDLMQAVKTLSKELKIKFKERFQVRTEQL
jgi:hypothetical protein